MSSLGRKSYVSQRGLAAALRELKDMDEAPEATSSESIKRIRDKELEISTPYGSLRSTFEFPVVQKKNTRMVEVPMVSLAVFMHHASSELPGFAAFLQQKLNMHPCSPAKPWRAAIYNDEVSPGNQLKGQNTRKLQVWYVAFLEYGKDNLWGQELWATIPVVRSQLLKKVPGGLSLVTVELIQRTFRDSCHNMETGIMLTSGSDTWTVYHCFGNVFGSCHDARGVLGSEGFLLLTLAYHVGGMRTRLSHKERVVFCCKLEIIVADESALKHMFDVKGSPGMVPCIHCSNVLAKRNAGDSDELLSICSTDVPSIKVKSEKALFKAAEHLAAQCGAVSAAHLNEINQVWASTATSMALCLEESWAVQPACSTGCTSMSYTVFSIWR